MNVCSVGYGYFPHKLKYQAVSCASLGMKYYYMVLKKQMKIFII